MKIRIAIRDKVGKDFRTTETIYAQTISEEGTRKLAEACASYMKYFIMATSEQATGHLASLITAEPIIGGWGVGDIPTLDKEAPYWNHCLAPETEVYIEQDNLIIPILLKDLDALWQDKKNIKILTPNGLKNINAIWKVNLEEYYKFDIAHWYNVKMSANHKLIYKLRNGFFEKTADSFGSAFKCSSILFTTLRSVNNHIIEEIKINNQNIKLDFLLGWMLGIILAEGSFGKNKISISQKCIDKLACYITEYCKQFNYLPIIESYKGYNCDRITINNKQIFNIIKYFISGLSHTKKFNKLFLNSPIDFRVGILEGYNLGDGRQSYKNGFQVRTVSEELRNQLLLIGSSLGYDCSLWKNDNYCGENSFNRNFPTIGGNIMYDCRKYNVKKNHCDKIGKDRKSLAKNRDNEGKIKPQNYKYVDFDYFPKAIIGIELIKQKKEFIDLQVDGELFLINGGIVSHNCDKGSLGINANWEHFLPKGFWSDGRWVTSSSGYAGIKPKTPIPAKNYIAKTLAMMKLLTPGILEEI